jgi:hypothetical protein
MAENEWGNAVVATALSVVDDTSLTGKAVVGDIKVRGYLWTRGSRVELRGGTLRWAEASFHVCVLLEGSASCMCVACGVCV